MVASILLLEETNGELVFPGGRPFCLRCGAEATGTARVTFESDPGFHFSRAGQILGHLEILADRVRFRAALCARHRGEIWKLRRACLGMGACAIGALVLGAAASGPERGATPAIAGIVVAVVLLLGMMPVWKRKDRGGLPCDVARAHDGRLILYYRETAPRPAWPIEEWAPEDPPPAVPPRKPMRRRPG
ncbi:MAG: hypothetical protein K8T20_13935 [Planctomycetes bacterium]|nr:hypothetical protein [Planctomycetota bacterium]